MDKIQPKVGVVVDEKSEVKVVENESETYTDMYNV